MYIYIYIYIWHIIKWYIKNIESNIKYNQLFQLEWYEWYILIYIINILYHTILVQPYTCTDQTCAPQEIGFGCDTQKVLPKPWPISSIFGHKTIQQPVETYRFQTRVVPARCWRWFRWRGIFGHHEVARWRLVKTAGGHQWITHAKPLCGIPDCSGYVARWKFSELVGMDYPGEPPGGLSHFRTLCSVSWVTLPKLQMFPTVFQGGRERAS